jgi:peptidoglycan/xylan/chitin deacetylase (PgdA/CDA1 family)
MNRLPLQTSSQISRGGASVGERLTRAFGALVRQPLVFRFFNSIYQNQVNIVFFHGIWPAGSDKLRLFWGITLPTFAKAISTLHRDFEFVSLDKAMVGSGTRGKAFMALTFDDGLETRSAELIEFLDDHNIPATAFVITRCLDNRDLMWRHKLNCIEVLKGTEILFREFTRLQGRLGLPLPRNRPRSIRHLLPNWPMTRKDEYAAALWKACDMPPLSEFLDRYKPYLTWAELRRWLDHGHTVGLHTESHPHCYGLSMSDLEREIFAPARLIESRLNVRSIPFAYPFGGRFQPQIEAYVRSTNVFSAMLGVNGLSPLSASPQDLERADGERHIDNVVYGQPIKHAFVRLIQRN